MWDWYDINKTKCHYEHLAHTHTWPDNEQKITMVLWLGWCPKNTDSGQYGTTKREKKLFLQNLTITCNLCHILDAPQKGVTQGEQMEADQAYSNSSPRNKLQVAPNNVRKCLEPGVTSGPGFGPGMLIDQRIRTRRLRQVKSAAQKEKGMQRDEVHAAFTRSHSNTRRPADGGRRTTHWTHTWNWRLPLENTRTEEYKKCSVCVQQQSDANELHITLVK